MLLRDTKKTHRIVYMTMKWKKLVQQKKNNIKNSIIFKKNTKRDFLCYMLNDFVFIRISKFIKLVAFAHTLSITCICLGFFFALFVGFSISRKSGRKNGRQREMNRKKPHLTYIHTNTLTIMMYMICAWYQRCDVMWCDIVRYTFTIYVLLLWNLLMIWHQHFMV